MSDHRAFVTADSHIRHKNVIVFEHAHRPFATIEEHDRAIVERWNATVRPKDTVWHLGDVFFGSNTHVIIASLNGIKRLVLGNHDHYPIAVYQQYFGKIFGAVEKHGCIMTHIPVHPCQLERRYRANIHGHMHSNKIDDPRYVCVSVEHTGLAPVLLTDVVNSTPPSRR